MNGKYRIGRIAALLVGVGGGLIVAFCLWMGVSALTGSVGFLGALMLPRLPLVALGGVCLVLFASVAVAVFDIADRKA